MTSARTVRPSSTAFTNRSVILGIFVSGKVAVKEHQEFAHNIDLIDCLPPGLYEAVIRPKAERQSKRGSPTGDFIVRFEMRTLDHIRALGERYSR